MELFDQITQSALTRALVAAFCGGVVGLEREIQEKPAGLKTNALICLGAALYVYFGTLIVEQGGDPTRIASQVVTGMGFIGAGTILRDGRGVVGLTTAATLWVVAAIGLFVGAGYFSLALVLTLITVGTLVFMRVIEVAIAWWKG